MNSRDSFLNDLQAFLEYKSEEGVQTVDISPETLAKFSAAPATSPKKESPKPSTKKRMAPPPSAPEPIATQPLFRPGQTLAEITTQIHACTACGLHTSRTRTVPGEGNPTHPDILFIGEYPNPDEDAQGRPFAGEAGQLLTKMIGAMGYTREQIFITNIVKCRPPGTRIPFPEETAICAAYLHAQIKLIQPKVIVALGKIAVEGLLKKPIAITRFRGTWCTYDGIDLMPTFHPGYLLKAPGKKREAWADLQSVLAKLGKRPPSKN